MTKSVQLIFMGWCTCKEHKVRPSSCPRATESWGNRSITSVRAGITSIGKERVHKVDSTLSREQNQGEIMTILLERWDQNLDQCTSSPLCSRVWSQAHCNYKWKDRAEEQGFSGETWGKVEAHPHVMFVPLEQAYLLILSGSNTVYKVSAENLAVWLKLGKCLILSVGNKQERLLDM